MLSTSQEDNFRIGAREARTCVIVKHASESLSDKHGYGTGKTGHQNVSDFH